MITNLDPPVTVHYVNSQVKPENIHEETCFSHIGVE